MKSISQKFPSVSRFAPAKSATVDPKVQDKPVSDGFEKSPESAIRAENKAYAIIVGTSVAVGAAVLATAAAVATTVAGAATGGVIAAAGLFASRDACLPKFQIKDEDSNLAFCLKSLANIAVVSVACGVVGVCAAGITGVLGPIVAGVNGATVGLAAGKVVGERIFDKVYDNN